MKFCRDSLWNSTVTWNTSDPNLTECARNTVLLLIPTVILLISLPTWSWTLSWSRSSGVSSKWTRIVVVVSLTVVMTTSVLLQCICMTLTPYVISDWIFVSTNVFIMLSVMTMKSLEIMGVVRPPSWIVPTVHFIFVVCSLPTFKAEVETAWNQSGPLTWFIALGHSTSMLIMFVVCCLNGTQHFGTGSPKELAGSVSGLFFLWMNDLIKRGDITTQPLD